MTQATKDALADAETLRRVARSFYRGFAYRYSDIAVATTIGEGEAEFLRDVNRSTYIGGYWARIAADRAFRAVPGLRG